MREEKTGFFQKHVEMFTILGVMVAGFALQEVRFSRIDARMSALEKEVTQIKTVLIIRGMMPDCMAKKTTEPKGES